MNTINIIEFKGYDAAAIKEYLSLQPGYEYQVMIPKESWSPEHPNDLIIQEYYTAMYTGQRLSLLAANFGYNVPCPFIAGQFIFHIEIVKDNLQSFSDLLAYIINGYLESVPNQASKIFHKDALDFFVRTDGDGDVMPECAGLWAICEKFFDYEQLPPADQ